jgi:hypothetical protein
MSAGSAARLAAAGWPERADGGGGHDRPQPRSCASGQGQCLYDASGGRYVGWSGAGINLRTDHPSPKVIAGAVQRVLNEPGFRDHTLALQAQTAGSSPAKSAADLLERLAVTGNELPRTGSRQ